MDPVSSVSVVSEKAKESHRQLIDILNDPRQAVVLMIGVAVFLALLFVIFNTAFGILRANSQVDDLQEKNKPEVVEKVKTDFDSIRKDDVEKLNFAIMSFYGRNNSYPKSLSNLVPSQLAEVPTDPETNNPYGYRVSVNLTSYEVWAVLEDGSEYLKSN